jgi:predicted site-specific integrase-resolvase
MQDKYLTASQLADKLQVNRTTIWRWEKAGLIKPTKIGKTKRFSPNEIIKHTK